MRKPADDDLQVALAEAGRLREQGMDPHHLAYVLLYLAQRVELLEAVYDAASLYLQFGQEEHEHAVLVNAIEAVRTAGLRDSEQEDQPLGL